MGRRNHVRRRAEKSDERSTSRSTVSHSLLGIASARLRPDLPGGRNMMIIVIAATSSREELECHECTNKHHESKIIKSNSGTRLAGCNYACGSGSTFGFKSCYSTERVGRQS